ncbi:MAG TPA: DUF3341 domain-containing protein [Steroidobacteraceae bacterium]|nr:DUF3341 domain-containing protein [Steroidobacteraceae bacterium]
MSKPPLYGLLAEFAGARQLVLAVHHARRAEPHAHIEAYAPLALAELNAALGVKRDHIALWTLLGAIIGGVGTYAIEWYSAVMDYPLNVGGRPPASWPAFLPPALEMTLLGAAVCGVIAMLRNAHLPRLHHPLFAVRAFERASSDRFFLLLRADAPGFDAPSARMLLESLTPLAVTEVAQ